MIAWFARNGVAANLLMFGVIGIGIYTLWADKIPLEVFPDSKSRMISVVVPYPASTPEETEETIVLKIEEAIQQVNGIKHVRSNASSGSGGVFVECEDNADPRRVMEDITVRVDAITTFPALAEKPIIQQDDFFRPFDSSYTLAPRNRPDLGAPAGGPSLVTIAVARADGDANTVPDLLNQQVKVRSHVHLQRNELESAWSAVGLVITYFGPIIDQHLEDREAAEQIVIPGFEDGRTDAPGYQEAKAAWIAAHPKAYEQLSDPLAPH